MKPTQLARVSSLATSLSTQNAPSSRPLLFGELLFDCFPNGREVIGGAPFNVTWNLRGLGLNPLLVSAVGDDALGHRALEEAEKWKLDLSAIRRFSDYPTGRVDVHNSENDPSYEFQEDCAWDHLEASPVLESDNTFALLYHGSLAVRAEESRRALEELRERLPLPRFVDLNLRPPHFEDRLLPSLVRGATWLKLNADELQKVSDLLALAPGDLADRARTAIPALQVENLLVTDGAEGAYWFTRDEEVVHFVPAPNADPMVDSVGAGDAFASITIYGLCAGWEPRCILERAVHFAARVCGLQGATSSEPQFYKNERNYWEIENQA